LTTENRRLWSEELLQTYCDAAGEQNGDPLYPLDRCQADVRRQAFFGIAMAIASSMLAEQTERGDEMFMTMLSRHCELVLDLGSMDLLPTVEAKVPLRPEPEDELAHAPGQERNWNESWYFDFVDEKQALAGWFRLGLTPNRSGNWYNAAITREGHPTVMLSDFEAPEVKDDLLLQTHDIKATHTVEKALERFRITVVGKGTEYTSAAAALDASPGRKLAHLQVTVDLTFTSNGTPYKYRVTPRYEIPCLVSGSLTIEDKTYSLRAVPGQRDHSWGVRDWWSMDWVWSSFHSHDTSVNVHALQVWLPGMPDLSVGYVQKNGATLEVQQVRCEPVYEEDGTASAQTIVLSIEDVGQATLSIEPKGHAGVRLLSDDGRVSLFERAWCTFKSSLGDEGVGWVEWNRNVVQHVEGTQRMREATHDD